MVDAGCGRELKGEVEVYYGDADGMADTWTGLHRKTHAPLYLHSERMCGSQCSPTATRSIRSKFRYCESCARRFGWIW